MAKRGRTTKYKPEYCEAMIKFFSIPHSITDNEGKEKANPLPTFENFAVSIGAHRETLLNWSKQDEEFSEAYKKCKDLQKDMLIDLGMRGLYNPTFTIFVAKNITDMKDRIEQDTTYTPPVIRVQGVTI